MPAIPQAAATQAPVPWTPAQIHDTVAAIVAGRRYQSAERESLLGRLLRWLWDRFLDLLDLVGGRVNPRVALLLLVTTIALVVIARVVVARQLDARAQRLGRGARGGLAGRQDYWTLATDEAAAGRYLEACHALYSAVVDALARSGSLQPHPSRTSGDYLRALRRSGSPAAADFRVFARLFDRLVFGTTTVGASDYDALRRAADGVVARRAAA